MADLNLILKELGEHHRTRNELFTSQIQLRLEDSLKAYYKSLQQSVQYLSGQDVKIVKKL